MESDNLLEMFGSIPRFNTYSDYSNTLNRVFKYTSLDNLIYNIKHPKIIKSSGFFEDDVKKINSDKKFLDNLLDNQPVQMEEEDDFFDEKYDKKNLKKKERKKKNKLNKSVTKKNYNNDIKIYKPESPDLNKYNPNYNAIYKNIHSVKIVLSDREKQELINKKKNNNKSKILKTHNNNTENNKEYNTENNNNEHNNNDNKSKILLTGVEEKKKNKKKIFLPPIIDKNNHAIKFESYTNRVFQIPKQNDKISYIEPYDYLSKLDKVIDFKKIRSRNEYGLIAPSQLDTPSFCYYRPKYDLVEKSSIKFKFKNDNDKDEYKNNKKYLMRKYIASYKDEPGYHIIDTKKLEENQIDPELRDRLANFN